MYVNQAVYITLSDFFINIAAGWFGAAIITPRFASYSATKVKLRYLTSNLFFAILCLVAALVLRII